MRAMFASISLRLGIAFVLLAAAILGFLAPQNWVGYIPSFATSFLPANTILAILGLYEIVLAIFILFKKNAHWPALLACITFLGITLTNLSQFEIVFRDVGLALMALALFFIGKIRA